MVHKFVKPKVSDYSNKLRDGLERCHLEQKNYCFKFDGQIQVGTIEHFLIRWRWNSKTNQQSFRPKNWTAVKIELIDMDSHLFDLCILLAQAQT